MESDVVKQEFEVKKEFLGIDTLMTLHPKSQLPLIQHILKRGDTSSLNEISGLMQGDNQAVKTELNRIIKEPIQKPSGVTTLHIYAAYGFTDAVRKFVEFGADPKSVMTTNEGELLTPLMLAVRYGHHEVADVLLGNAASALDAKTLTAFFNMKQKAQDFVGAALPNGTTPLHIFCALGYTQLVKDLLKLNINKTSLMTAPEGSKYSPIMLAMLFGHNKIVQLLLTNLTIAFSKELQGIPGAPTLLEIASHLNNVEMVQFLLQKGVNPNHRYHDLNRTALYWAVRNNNPEICEALLFAGAETNLVMQGEHEDDLINVNQVIKLDDADKKIVSLLDAFNDSPARLLAVRITQHVCQAMKECAAKDKAGIKSAEFIKGATLLKAMIATEGDRAELVKAHFVSLPKAAIKGYDFSLFDQLLAKLLTSDPDFCELFDMKVNGLSNFADRRPRVVFVEALQKPKAAQERHIPEEHQPEIDPADGELPPSASSFVEGVMVTEESSAKPVLKAPSGPGFFARLFSSNGKKTAPPLAPATDLLSRDANEDEVLARRVSTEESAVESKQDTVSEPEVMVGQIAPMEATKKQAYESDSDDYIDGYLY